MIQKLGDIAKQQAENVIPPELRHPPDPMFGRSLSLYQPTYSDAERELKNRIRDVQRKLEIAVSRGAPADYIAKGQDLLARLQGTVIDAYLIEVRERHKQEQLEHVREQRERAWTRFVAKRGRRYEPCTLDNYEVTHDAQRPVVEAMRGYAAELPTNIASGKGIVLFGSCGTGKDHLITALTRTAIIDHGFDVWWCNGTSLPDETPSDIPDVISISDPMPPGGLDTAGGYQTRDNANKLYRLVDGCYSDERPMWVTMNATSRTHAVEQLGAQAVDRMTDNAIVMACNWPTYRQPHE